MNKAAEGEIQKNYLYVSLIALTTVLLGFSRILKNNATCEEKHVNVWKRCFVGRRTQAS